MFSPATESRCRLAVMKEAAQLAAMARKMIDYCNEVLCE